MFDFVCQDLSGYSFHTNNMIRLRSYLSQSMKETPKKDYLLTVSLDPQYKNFIYTPEEYVRFHSTIMPGWVDILPACAWKNQENKSRSANDLFCIGITLYTENYLQVVPNVINVLTQILVSAVNPNMADNSQYPNCGILRIFEHSPQQYGYIVQNKDKVLHRYGGVFDLLADDRHEFMGNVIFNMITGQKIVMCSPDNTFGRMESPL